MSKGKNNQRKTRADKVEERHQPPAPLKPLNTKQRYALEAINSSPITFFTGHAGTSKTYLPVRKACQWLLEHKIERIVFLRPAVSASQSVGFAKGTHEEKMWHWLAPIIDILVDCFGYKYLKYLLQEEIGRIKFVPLENCKGSSWNDAFVIVDEAEDCTVKEIKNLITRVGQNTTMAICGDTRQKDFEFSGLGIFAAALPHSTYLQRIISHIDYCEYEDIVRSGTCKTAVMGLDEVDHLLTEGDAEVLEVA